MRYNTAAAFRKALEDRLNAMVVGRSDSLIRLRKLVTFERFVARIQAGGDDHWLLKGGFALQLRLGERARTTKDVDLGANLGVFGKSTIPPEEAGDLLAKAAARDLGDHFIFQVGAARELSLKVGPVRAYRHPVNGLLAGKTFERFHVDAGVGDPVVAPPADLPPSGYLDFAELPPVRFRAVAPEQHFAEKVHALTLPREGVENTRTRDLADAMLLLNLGLPGTEAVRAAVRAIFDARGTHPVPRVIGAMPVSWKPEYEALAAGLGLAQRKLDEAMARLEEYWKGLQWQDE